MSDFIELNYPAFEQDKDSANYLQWFVAGLDAGNCFLINSPLYILGIARSFTGSNDDTINNHLYFDSLTEALANALGYYEYHGKVYPYHDEYIDALALQKEITEGIDEQELMEFV